MSSHAPPTVIVYQAPWDWDFLWNRAQPLATALSRHAEVLYLNGGIVGPSAAWRGVARTLSALPGASRWQRQRIDRVSPTLSIWSWQALAPDPMRMICGDRPEWYYGRLDRHLRRRAAEGARIWLLNSRPLAKRLRRLRSWDSVIIDIEDPWFDLNWGHGLDREAVLDAMRDADLVFGNGAAIADEYQALCGRRVVSLPNGVDAAFLELLGKDAAAPECYGDSGGSMRAAFTGNVNDRLDYAVIAELVREPGWTFFFIGQDNVPGEQRQRWEEISARPNVRIVPPRPHHEIAALLQHADALLLPYFRSGHEKMFPAKLFEYAATGKPIITTMDFTRGTFTIPSALICNSAGECRDALRRIRADGGRIAADVTRACMDVARRNTWDSRAADVMRLAAGDHEGDSDLAGRDPGRCVQPLERASR